MISPSDKNQPPELQPDVKHAASPNCPRCDSPNTKFCYYNNYSLAQPRHFCKSCKRYWTKGGALRNVPVGGACRKKNKISNSTKTCFSRNINISSDHSIEQFSTGNSSISGLKFFQGDFHEVGGGINLPIINNNSLINPMSSSSYSNRPCSNLNVETSAMAGFGTYQEMGSSVSCIESLSSINQELHWKLQQQRLMGGIYSIEENHYNYQKQAQSPINYVFMENLNKSAEIKSCKSRMNGNLGGEATWYLDNCYEGASSSHHEVNPRNINIDDQNINGGGSVQAWRSHFRHPYNTA